MKLAFITPTIIDEPTTGFRTRLYQLQEVLGKIANGSMTTMELNGRWDAAVDDEPGADRRGTDAGMAGLARDLAGLACHSWPTFTSKVLSDADRARVLAWVDQTRPTHVVTVHPFTTDLMPDLARRNVRAYIDSQNVESDLARQLIGLAATPRQRVRAVMQWRAIQRWERRFFPLAAEVWVPSPRDALRQIEVCSRRATVRSVPNALDVRRFVPHEAQPSHDVLLPAFFGFGPNVAGAKVFRNRLLPAVRSSVTDARLVLLGKDPDGAARALQRDPDVVATGEVPDTRPYIRGAGVVVVPILQGGGTRYKILEALALGRPVVSTPLGAMGLDVRDGEHLLIRDIDAFPEAIVSILRDPAYGRRLGMAGRKLVQQQYSWETVERIMRDALFERERAGAIRNASGTPVEGLSS